MLRCLSTFHTCVVVCCWNYNNALKDFSEMEFYTLSFPVASCDGLMLQLFVFANGWFECMGWFCCAHQLVESQLESALMGRILSGTKDFWVPNKLLPICDEECLKTRKKECTADVRRGQASEVNGWWFCLATCKKNSFLQVG